MAEAAGWKDHYTCNWDLVWICLRLSFPTSKMRIIILASKHGIKEILLKIGRLSCKPSL